MVEEGPPDFIEQAVNTILRRRGVATAVAGKDVLPTGGEYTPAVLGKGVEAFLAAHCGEVSEAAVLCPSFYRADDLPEPPASVEVPALDALLDRTHAFPAPLRPMLFAGVKRLVDYQGPAYAADYLGRLERLLAFDRAAGGEAHGLAFSNAAAKYLAAAMAYDDVVRARADTTDGRVKTGEDSVKSFRNMERLQIDSRLRACAHAM